MLKKLNAGIEEDTAAAASSGTVEAGKPEEPPAEDDATDGAPSGWGGWQPLAPAEGAADPEAGSPEQVAADDAGQTRGELDANGAAEVEGGSDGGSGDSDDDEVAEGQAEEEQETEEELLAQCAPTLPPCASPGERPTRGYLYPKRTCFQTCADLSRPLAAQQPDAS